MQKTPNAALNRLSVDDFKQATKSPFVVVLDNIRSAHNVGATFRTSDAFLVEAIYLCGITGKPPHRDINKAALGATDSVTWHYEKDTVTAIRQLKEQGYQIIAIEQAAESVALQNFEVLPQQKYALVFGHEVKGVQQAVMDEVDACIEIPQFGTKHSFNISVSVGIVLWELWRKWFVVLDS